MIMSDRNYHESSRAHVTGAALYADDISNIGNLLHGYVQASTLARGTLCALDLERVRQSPGVVAVLTAADVPGVNDLSHLPDGGGEPLFIEKEIVSEGQAVFAVIADSLDNARQAAKLAVVEVEPSSAVITIDQAIDADSKIAPSRKIKVGDSTRAIDNSDFQINGSLYTGGQEHFYLEGQISIAMPKESGAMTVIASTQHPSEIQSTLALLLGVSSNSVTVQTRRIGGGFGGKESQGSLCAGVAAIAAQLTSQPVKVRLDRDQDMIMTGKRHDFRIDYKAGFDNDGLIRGVSLNYASRCGHSLDQSKAVNDRTLLHADNAYYLENATLTSHRYHTNTTSNTAFRGFGAPQGMLGIERVIEEIAFTLQQDPLDIRLANLYRTPNRSVTPYGQEFDSKVLVRIIGELTEHSEYRSRRKKIRRFNQDSPVIKKGIALTPVKFGISFTAIHLNQAGALLHIYRDGSVQLNHAGVEMGQGLHTKILRIVQDILTIERSDIRIMATNTEKIPNTSPTAASAATDLNGMAAASAATVLHDRLIKVASHRLDLPEAELSLSDGFLHTGDKPIMSFKELVNEAYLQRVSLFATGFYRTPDINFDPDSFTGSPFYYYANGAAVSEVEVDLLTGEHKVNQVDILHEVGQSLNEEIDKGQIEGGFIQGMGWLTMEELVWNDQGVLQTHSPSTYKIPTCRERPSIVNIDLLRDAPNQVESIYRSKAVGEPPLMLSISVLHALSDAISSIANYRFCPQLNVPATPEHILESVQRVEKLGLASV